MAKAKVELPEFVARSLGRGHPWVYRDHVPHGARFADGSIVRVVAGSFSGWGIWDERSPIALRMLSTAEREPDARWVAERVHAAWQLRAVVRSSRTSAFR